MGPLPSQQEVAAMFSDRLAKQDKDFVPVFHGGTHKDFTLKCAKLILEAAEAVRQNPGADHFKAFYDKFCKGRRAIVVENEQASGKELGSQRFGSYRADPDRIPEPSPIMTTRVHSFIHEGELQLGYGPLQDVCAAEVLAKMAQAKDSEYTEKYEIAGYKIRETAQWYTFSRDSKVPITRLLTAMRAAKIGITLSALQLEALGIPQELATSSGPHFRICCATLLQVLERGQWDPRVVGSALQLLSNCLSNPEILALYKQRQPKAYELGRVESAYVTMMLSLCRNHQERFSILSTHVAIPYKGKRTYVNMSKRLSDMSGAKPITMLLHQDLHLLPDTIKALGTMYSEALAAPDFETLKERVALFRWSYGNACPNWRGDGAVGNMFELAAYIAKGHRPRYAPGSMPSGDCLARGPKAFLEAYDAIVLFDLPISSALVSEGENSEAASPDGSNSASSVAGSAAF